jgi:hypothetical protein
MVRGERTANTAEKCDEKTKIVIISIIKSNQMSSYVCWRILLNSQQNHTRKQGKKGRIST